MDDSTRKIAAFMAFAVVFALVGHAANRTTSKVGDTTILLGGTIGAVLLALLAQAGGEAASYAEGLAGITLVSSVLINGLPVFKAVDRLTTKATPGTMVPTLTPTTVGAP